MPPSNSQSSGVISPQIPLHGGGFHATGGELPTRLLEPTGRISGPSGMSTEDAKMRGPGRPIAHGGDHVITQSESGRSYRVSGAPARRAAQAAGRIRSSHFFSGRASVRSASGSTSRAGRISSSVSSSPASTFMIPAVARFPDGCSQGSTECIGRTRQTREGSGCTGQTPLMTNGRKHQRNYRPTRKNDVIQSPHSARRKRAR